MNIKHIPKPGNFWIPSSLAPVGVLMVILVEGQCQMWMVLLSQGFEVTLRERLGHLLSLG